MVKPFTLPAYPLDPITSYFAALFRFLSQNTQSYWYRSRKYFVRSDKDPWYESESRTKSEVKGVASAPQPPVSLIVCSHMQIAALP